MWGVSTLRVPTLTRNVPHVTPPDPQAVAIGQAVRGALAQADLTQQYTAEQMPMAITSLSRRINGGLPFTFPELVRISRLTGVTLGELVATAERIASRTEPASV